MLMLMLILNIDIKVTFSLLLSDQY